MNPEDIANQRELLAAHRRTLAIYLRQLAHLDADYAPPVVHNGIAEARAEIQRIKVWLRVQRVSVTREYISYPAVYQAARSLAPFICCLSQHIIWTR
jgi:hypothetical protein